MKQHVLRFSMFIDAIKMQFAQIFYIYISFLPNNPDKFSIMLNLNLAAKITL